jgi:hypothetical protein
VRGVLGRLRFQIMRHQFWGVALSGIFLVSCGADSPKSEEQKPTPSILPAPKPEAPALKKAQLGPQPDLGSVIILEVPGEGAQSFYLKGQPGARYLAKVTPLYGSSKTKKKRVVAVEKAEKVEKATTDSLEASKPPQGFAATFFAVAESPALPGNFYTAETLKGLKEERYQLPAPLPPTEAAQAAETAPANPAPEQNATQKDPQDPALSSNGTPPPLTLPESLWSPVTNKGIEVFDVETEVLPGNTSNSENQATQPVVLEIKNLDAVPRTVKIVIREKKS